MARNDLEDLEKRIYEMEYALKKMGMQKRFSVILDYKDDPVFLDKSTSMAYRTFQEVLAAADRVSKDVRTSRTRERNVSKGAKPVSIKKGARLSDKVTDGVTRTGVGLSFDERSLMQSQKKYRADKSRVEAYNRREKRNIVSISDMTADGNYTFKVNGVTYRTLDSAFSAANDLKKGSIRHDDFYEKPSLEDIEHYGVLGMKWGVRKDPKRAYSKATKKLERLDTSATKAGNKAARSQQESIRKQQRASSALLLRRAKSRSAARSIRKTNRRYLSAQRKVNRAKRWYDAMDSTFKSTKISSLDPSKTELGKKYANMKLTDAMSSATTAASMVQLMNYYEQQGRK